jgi:hypothetical protein
MGLHTTYVGRVDIVPPLPGETADWLRAFARTRHWDHPDGPLRVARHPADDEPGDHERGKRTAPGLPSFYCPWTVCEDGCCLRWDALEKPYAGERWLAWLIDNVLAPEHVADGMLIGESRESGAVTALDVVGNVVTTRVLVPPRSGSKGWDDQGELAGRVEQVLQRARRFRAGLEAEREPAPVGARKGRSRS